MYALLRLTDLDFCKRVVHIRGENVEKVILPKDAICVHDVVTSLSNEDHKCSKYFYFILRCSEGDMISFNDEYYKMLTNKPVETIVYYIEDMCKILVNQGKKFPKKLENLLKEVIPSVFKKMSECNGLCSRKELFQEHLSLILKNLGKSLYDYVSQDGIDEYIHSLIIRHQFKIIEEFVAKEKVKISNENIKALEKAKKDLKETIEIAKKCLNEAIGESSIDVALTEIFENDLVMEGTPCGRIIIHLSYDRAVKLIMDNKIKGLDETMIDITEECMDILTR